MLAELGGVSKIIIAVGYTDYPRRIIMSGNIHWA